MAAPTTLHLYETAVQILTDVIGALSDPPARAYVSPGLPAADCNQLTVHFDGSLMVGLPIGRPNCVVYQDAEFVVELWRCHTGLIPKVANNKIIPPSVADLNAASQILLRDQWEILAGLVDTMQTMTCKGASIQLAQTSDNEGGMVGAKASIVIQLELPIAP